MRITLNLATRPFADLGPAIKRLRIAMAVLAFIAICLGVGLHAIHQKAEAARAREHSLDGQIAQINHERQSYQDLMRQPANAQLLAHVQKLNSLFDLKAFSWTLAMEDLETVLPGGVQVASIEPIRAKDGHITIHLRVVGPRDRTVDLVRNLEHSRRFLLPRIVGENAESTGGPGERLEPISASNRVDFDLLAEYNPAVPGERRPTRKPAAAHDTTAGQPSGAHSPGSPVIIPGQHPGRPPYTGSSQPVIPGRNPALLPSPTPGGPQ